MDSIKIRELEEKSLVHPEDTMIIEDNTGTLKVPVSALQTVMQGSLFCKTVEDMKRSVFNAGDVVQTQGYYQIGDGGMGLYLIVNAPDELDNGITILSLHTSDGLRAHLLYDDYISPMQAGAYGDGEHDDTDALNALLQLNIPVRFPKKNFKASIRITNSIIIDFNGATISSDTTPLTILSNVKNQKISNVFLKAKDGELLRIDGPISNTIIENCIFNIHKYNSAITIVDAANTSISNCIFNDIDNYEVTSLIDINTKSNPLSKTIIADCNFNNIKSPAIRANGKVSISKCTFNSCNSARDYHLSFLDDGEIDNCIFSGRPAIYSNLGSFISVSDTSCDKAVNGIDMYSNSTVNLDNLFIFGATDNTSQTTDRCVIGSGSSSDSRLVIDGTIIFDRLSNSHTMAVSEIGSGQIYNRNNYSDIIQAQPNASGVIDLSSILPSTSQNNYKYGIVNADILIISSNPIRSIINGTVGQIIRLYGNNNQHIYCNDKGTGHIYAPTIDNQTPELILSYSDPIILRYGDNNRWTRI